MKYTKFFSLHKKNKFYENFKLIIDRLNAL